MIILNILINREKKKEINNAPHLPSLTNWVMLIIQVCCNYLYVFFPSWSERWRWGGRLMPTLLVLGPPSLPTLFKKNGNISDASCYFTWYYVYCHFFFLVIKTTCIFDQDNNFYTLESWEEVRSRVTHHRCRTVFSVPFCSAFHVLYKTHYHYLQFEDILWLYRLR